MGRNFKEEILGKRYKTIFDEWYEVIDYNGTHNVTIKFDNGSIRNCVRKKDVINGHIKNLYRTYNYGKYLGEPI